MSFNEQPPPPKFFRAWSPPPHNLYGSPNFNHHRFFRQSGPFLEHVDVPVPPQKRERQSEKNIPKYTSLPLNPIINPTTSFPGDKGTGNIFFKTRICVKFSEGNCKNADNCNFAHGVDDLRCPPPNWQKLVSEKEPAWTWRFGEEQKRNQGMKICKRFYNGEECPYGEKCIFLHERSTPSFLDDQGRERERERESSAISIAVSSNQGRTGGLKPPLHCKSNTRGERSQFVRRQTGSYASSSRDGVEAMVNSRGIQAKPLAAHFRDPSRVVVTSDHLMKREKDNNNGSRWKLNKKINRIYADWLDDLSPPRTVEADAET